MNFKEKYTQIKQLGQSEIKKIEQKMVTPINTREPLNSYLKDFLNYPSKRIRPLLAILYTKACEQNLTEEQLELLSIIELIHNASLIHDDVIDNCDTRRNHKTLSAEFDNKLAVISGDYILAIAMEKLTQINNIEIIKKISQTIKQMCIGEINQNFDRFKIGTIENYIEKTKNKTALLFECTLYCCALLNNPQKHDLGLISQLGLDIGIAFQIRDDLLNLSTIDTTKPIKNDVQDGIYNAPIIYAQDINNYSSGIEKTKDLLNNYIQNAKLKIKDLPNNNYKTALFEFLELLNNV